MILWEDWNKFTFELRSEWGTKNQTNYSWVFWPQSLQNLTLAWGTTVMDLKLYCLVAIPHVCYSLTKRVISRVLALSFLNESVFKQKRVSVLLYFQSRAYKFIFKIFSWRAINGYFHFQEEVSSTLLSWKIIFLILFNLFCFFWIEKLKIL
jgi:hypothetical protein